MATRFADIDMPAERGRAAGDNGLDHPRLNRGDRGEASLLRERAQEVGNLQCWPRHLDGKCFGLYAVEWTGCRMQSLR